MDLQLKGLVHAHEHLIQSQPARTADLQFHLSARLDSIKLRVRRVHVNVPHRPDDSLGHLKEPLRSHQHPARRSFNIARYPQRNLKAQSDGIRISQFNLVEIAARTQDAQIRNYPAARTDQRQRLFRRELPVLIEPLKWRQRMPLPEQRFHRLRRQVAMPRTDIHDQRIGCRSHPWQSLPKPLIHSLSDAMFDHRPMRTIYSLHHEIARNVAKTATIVNIFLAKYIKIFQIQPEMQLEARQKRIQDYLNRVEFASLEELAQSVEASVSTVRRDVAALAATGSLRRTHGGARLVNPPAGDEFAFTARDTRQLAEKEAIGRACAELIAPGQTVIIDAGTTAYHVAKYLEPKTPQIITNSLPVANLFAPNNRVELVLSGGVIYPRLGVLVGPLAVEAFSKIHADVAVMSAGGITLEGISNSHGLLIEIQLAMIRAAQRVIFCFDSTKLGRRSLSSLCGLESLSTIVTDSGAPEDLVGQLRERGLEVVIAPVEKEALGIGH
jgi:DeoR family transcriptional regulator, fructose operon transcriptional repressor